MPAQAGIQYSPFFGVGHARVISCIRRLLGPRFRGDDPGEYACRRGDRMNRRECVALLAGAAPSLLWPLAARAQQRPLPVIGLLSSRSAVIDAPLIAIIRQGLNDGGFVEGRNFTVEYRWAEGQFDRLAALAGDLVSRQVAVIV